MQSISREQVKRKLDDGSATIVEVLGEEHYRKFHLPNSINVPIDENFDEHIQSAIPDKNAEVILYCHDKECNASPKAARRMEALGYQHVYDYEEGKVDWKDADLPIES